MRYLFFAMVFLTRLVGIGDTVSGRVIDGDTVVVLGRGKVQHQLRFQGIDAPEREQAYGKASGRRLSELSA